MNFNSVEGADGGEEGAQFKESHLHSPFESKAVQESYIAALKKQFRD